jgi:pantoate--beta-alanine ligase
MGALHAGHLALVARAREVAGDQGQVWVSLFVNPTQFGPGEDYQRYPRPREADLSACESAGVDVVFAPQVQAMYPPAEAGAVACDVDVPGLTGVLEGASRPGHFAGVCRVVAKLLGLCQPTAACFGEKDFQQLRVIEAMVADLCWPVRVVRCETVREPDGLAMSSRNRYLDPADRQRALGLSRALGAARQAVAGGAADVGAVEAVMRAVLEQHELAVDYAVVRDAATLRPAPPPEAPPAPPPEAEAKVQAHAEGAGMRGMRALIAARAGAVRLIDNCGL